jgi:3-hydroxyisobutyrate dehydrogenase-like beta-hydroxyacid dehydrogenase
MPEIKHAAMIGLGKMGRPMARHLVAKGLAVHGYDIDESAARRSE